MNKVIFMVGNIGSGKSTFIEEKDFSNAISKDDFREFFGEEIGEEYLWDEVLEEMIHEVCLSLFEAFLHIGKRTIALDETNMSKETRSVWVRIAKRYGYKCVAYVFEDMGEEAHLNRRMTHPRGFDREYWREVYKRKQESYEPPTTDEGFDEINYIKQEE